MDCDAYHCIPTSTRLFVEVFYQLGRSTGAGTEVGRRHRVRALSAIFGGIVE
jgi:hypothetical protein